MTPALQQDISLAVRCHDGGTVLAAKKRGRLTEGIVRENEVYAIEPSCINGLVGAHIEDDIVVTKNGCELLSHRQKELYLIPYKEGVAEA